MTKTWDDVDQAIRQIGDADIALANINGDLTAQINVLKKAAKDKSQPFLDTQKQLTTEITAFVKSNKHEFVKKRSMDLVFGKIAFHVSKSLTLPKAKEKVESIIKVIKAMGISNCVVQAEALDRAALDELTDAELAKINLARKTKDNLRIEPNLEKIASTPA